MPLLFLFLVPLLFTKTCLNNERVRQEILSYAQQQGLVLSYGEVTAFSWWDGIAVDYMHLEKNGAGVDLTDISYLLVGDLHVAEAMFSVDASMFDANKDASIDTMSIDPSLLALIPERSHIDMMHIEAGRGSYKGSVELVVHAKQEMINVSLQGQGQWQEDEQQEPLTGSVQTVFSLALSQGRLDMPELAIKNEATELMVTGLQIEAIFSQPDVSITHILVKSDVDPYIHLLAELAPQLSRFQHVELDADDFRYGINEATLLLKLLLLKTANDGVAELTGPVKWRMQNKISLLESDDLALKLSIPDPQTWGITIPEEIQFTGHLRGGLSVAESGGMALNNFDMNSLIKLGEKRWLADFMADSLKIDNDRVILGKADIKLIGDESTSIAGEQLRAGKYLLTLSRTTLDLSDLKKLDWQTSADVDVAIQGMPALVGHLDSTGIRQSDRTEFTTLNLTLIEGEVNATIQGTLHDSGLAHRSSRMQGSLSVGSLAALKYWSDFLPDMEGEGRVKWKSEGRGSDKVYLQSKMNVSKFNLNLNGLNLQGGELDLPFRQQLNLSDFSLKRGRMMNGADLSRVSTKSLPGSLSFKLLAMEGFELTDSQLAMQFDDGLLLGKVEQGKFLDGNVSGYFQLSIPDKEMSFPKAFARFSLLHADSARLNPDWQAEASRLNIYATIKSDGRDLSGRLSVPDIQRQSLDHLIDWLDPDATKASLQNIKQMMEKYHYAPSSTDARLQNQYADVDVVLKSSGGSKMHIPIHNLSVGHLIGQ
ncbi:hypothetical protein D8Y20_10715 [Mariprofundus sp. EBB-1]|uniref:hypothetical protein n=1 Tax=Mariprofundus sp. EBB-1 TaxID=2650971 RepID=UPI000EF1CD3B|nr:hypothetical protein [Mariprofundus sp. EBB-1]RLL50854.1 hypothetical protein D8Y20_10715 [Mariprofundus sp. EBB-1]